MDSEKIVNDLKKTLEIETKLGKMVITEYRLFGSINLMTKIKYSEPKKKD